MVVGAVVQANAQSPALTCLSIILKYLEELALVSVKPYNIEVKVTAGPPCCSQGVSMSANISVRSSQICSAFGIQV